MGKCWNCKTEVFLKDEEVRCDRCKQIVRYKCNNCKKLFDVQNKETKKKVKICLWCGFFLCPNCNSCSPDCQKYEHHNKIKQILNNLIPVDKWQELNQKVQEVVDYFGDIKMGRKKTSCEFGVPKTYAKERIKHILARMKGFKVRDFADQDAFEKRQKEILNKEIGHEFTIGNSRNDGSYGQEYRDIFNLCVCLGTLEHEKKSFKNDKGIEISYDSWVRIEEEPCEFLDTKELIVKYCPQCAKTFSKDKTYCDECKYKSNYKGHQKGDLKNVPLKEKLSDIPTCKNIGNFKEGEKKEDGKKSERKIEEF